MKWASTLLSAEPDKQQGSLAELLSSAADEISKQLSGQAPDLAVVFVSPNFAEQYDLVPKILKHKLKPRQLIGCSASGLIGGGKEIETKPAVALTAACLPGVDIQSWHVVNADLPDLDDAPDKWEKLLRSSGSDQPSFILLPDPYSFKIDVFLQGIDFAFPQSAKIGGLASGASQSILNALFLNGRVYRNGMVGVAMSGNLLVETIVAQGCRPIAKPLRVTKSKKNFIFELNGKTAVHALHELIEQLSPIEQQLVKDSLFIGIAMDEFKDAHQPGDFLIRNIIGIEPNTGAVVVNEVVRDEQTIQFHVRDAAASADDLRQMLKRYRDTHEGSADGALLFSCLGRGEHLYGMPNHDSQCFQQYLGAVPLGGFFCNGEIGPVGGTTFLHGYTSSFGIFTSKSTVEKGPSSKKPAKPKR
jgi:small ligand-binding sensory domain FIST